MRFYLRLQTSDTALAALSYIAQYFTLLTNTIILLVMLWVALGRGISARLLRAAVISIICVGVVYHAVLAHLVSLSGIALWADHGTHTFVPALAALWWVFLAPKPRLTITDPIIWVAWPLIYCAYILIRASSSGFYPDPFLNLPDIGSAALATNIAGLSLGFIIAGLILTAIGHLIDRMRS